MKKKIKRNVKNLFPIKKFVFGPYRIMGQLRSDSLFHVF